MPANDGKYTSDEEIAACAESRTDLERRRANIHSKVQDAWQKHLMEQVKLRATGDCIQWIDSLSGGGLEVAEFKLGLIGADNFLETWESPEGLRRVHTQFLRAGPLGSLFSFSWVVTPSQIPRRSAKPR